MQTTLFPDIEVMSVEPEGWCVECHRFSPVYSVLVHQYDQPADFVELCGPCVKDLRMELLHA